MTRCLAARLAAWMTGGFIGRLDVRMGGLVSLSVCELALKWNCVPVLISAASLD